MKNFFRGVGQCFAVVVVVLILGSGDLWASRTKIPCTGYLVDTSSDNTPLSGSHTINCAFYDALTSGTLVSESGTTTVTVTDGVFTLFMDPPSGDTLFLEVVVDGTALSPRAEIGAALYANSANALGSTVATAGLADSSVTTAKISDGTIAAADLATSAVTTTTILDGTIAADDLASSSVTTAKISDGTIAAADLADSSVTSAKISDATIATADLADSSVTSAKISDATIATADLADSSVTSAKIADGVVASADVGSDLDFADFDNALDLDAALTLNQSTNAWTQNFTGTTGTGETYNATSLTTGKAMVVNATNTSTSANPSVEQVQFNLTNAQSTAAIVSPDRFVGLGIAFTNNPSVAGNNEVAMSIQNQQTSNVTDNAVSALLSLDNADTSTTGSTVVTAGLSITNTGGITGGIANGITIGSGTQSIGNGIVMNSTGITNDIVLQNSEVISNDTDGVISFNGAQIVNALPLISNKTANYTVSTSTDAVGTVFTTAGAPNAIITFSLPTASTSLSYTFCAAHANSGGVEVTVDPNGTNQILGITNAAGDSISNSGLGDCVTLTGISSTQWVVTTGAGWDDTN